MNKNKRNQIKKQFASIFEKVIYDDAKSRGINIKYEPVTIEYWKRSPKGAICADCNSTNIKVPGKYTPDFELDGGVFVEAKGFFKPEKRSRMEDFIRSKPRILLKFLFAQDNWMTKKKKHKYSDWAKKMGVDFAIGKKIPEQWTKGCNGANTVADNGMASELAFSTNAATIKQSRRSSTNLRKSKRAKENL